MGTSAAWAERTGSLDESQREMLTGGGLSKRFSRLPLWLSHPSNIGAFYGFLVSLALILPCLLYTSPSPRDGLLSRMPSSA